MKKAHKNFERKIVKSFKECPKRFYSYVNSKQHTRSGISHIRKDDDSITNTDTETAQLLCDYFSSVFIDNEDDNLPDFNIHANPDDIVDLEFTVIEVEKRKYLSWS